MRLLAAKDWTWLEERCLPFINLRIPRHATSSASYRILRPTRPTTHKMSQLSVRTSPNAETAESTRHASRHLYDSPSFTPSVRLMKTQTATEWGLGLQWFGLQLTLLLQESPAAHLQWQELLWFHRCRLPNSARDSSGPTPLLLPKGPRISQRGLVAAVLR